MENLNVVGKTLYRKNNKGSIQAWTVSYKENKVFIVWGVMESLKFQETVETTKAKNVGKANGTTPEEQAKVRAQQLYDKKIKEGYTPDLDLARSTNNVLDGVKPMLAFPIEKKEKYVSFPAFVQPKLDGVRCIAVIVDGKCTLYTRSQKVINTVPHINAGLENIFENVNLTLDGELYNHDYKENFNKIISLIKRDEVHEDHKLIQYHIYDLIEKNVTYDKRIFKLGIFKPFIENEDYLELTETKFIENYDGVSSLLKRYLTLGYEGAMLRSQYGLYENKRSTGLLKIKTMQDAEFKIVGVLEGKGKLAGHAGSFVCMTSNGKTFKAKLKGKLEYLKECLINFDKYEGQSLTVQYQNLTPDGLPRFPVGLRIRMEE